MNKNLLLAFALALSLTSPSFAQTEAIATLEIDTENVVVYRHDVFDATRVSTQPGPTTPLPIRTFMHATWIADVVAVNGTPAKGTMTIRGTWVALNPNPGPGVGIADINNSLAADYLFDIQRADGSPVGTIMAGGWVFGTRTAGFVSPGQGNFAALGGTGAFLGVRGQGKEGSQMAGQRTVASVTEDPANRRIHGGSLRRYTLQLIPMVRPDFIRSGNDNAVFHSDFSPVTPSNPARKGELLIVAATGLGPTLPGKQPDALFAADSLQEVASPIQVLVNGIAVNASNQIGWPGTTGTYRVDFQVPEHTAAGAATVKLVSAWIPGPSIEIPVR